MNPDRHTAARALLGAVILAGVGPAIGQSASARDAEAMHVRSIAATCAACHGTDGRAVPGEAMVTLAGYPREPLVARLKAYRNGNADATVMHQIARGYTDQQIEALAAYFAAQAVGPR